MRSKPAELAQAVAVAKMRLRGFIMKQGKHHKGPIAHVKDLMRELNKYKQGRDGINMPIYIASDFSDVLKEINAIGVGYKNKQHGKDKPPTQDQILTPQELESVENKDEFEQVLIVGNYDRTK